MKPNHVELNLGLANQIGQHSSVRFCNECTFFEAQLNEVMVFITYIVVISPSTYNSVGKHNLSEEEQGELLHLLREIAFANTVTQYQANLDSLMASSVYKDHPRVQRYLKTKWLGCTTVSYMHV